MRRRRDDLRGRREGKSKEGDTQRRIGERKSWRQDMRREEEREAGVSSM